MKTRLFNLLSQKALMPLMMVLLCVLGTTDAWAGNSHSTHYGKVTAGKVTNAANGTVYVATSSTKPSAETTEATWNCGGSSGSDTKTCYWWATPNDGYYCEGWYSAQAGTGSAAKTTANFSESVTATGTSSSKATTKTYYAKFEPVAISLYDGQAASENIDAQYAKHTYTGSVSFGTTGADAQADFVVPAFEDKVGNGVYTMTSWSYANNKVIVNYSFTGNSAAGTTTANLVLRSAGRENSSKVAFSATSVAPTITSGNAGAQLTPSTPTDLAEGTATFNVTNAEDASYFAAPTFINVQGGGTWKILSTSYAAGVYTVNYSFQSDASHLGDHSADLTLTATVGSATKTVTATAFTEAIATEDAKVTSSTGTLIYQGDWATALSKANTAANAGCTLTLLRNVDVTAQQSVTNTFTLDLNGKKLSNTNLGDSPTNILYINGSGKTLTIQDSKSGGEVHGVGSRNSPLYAVYVNSGHLILNSGKLYIENTMVYNSSTAKSVEADGVRAAAKMTITMNGGEVEAVADRNAKGLQNNGSGSDTSNGITINGGSIYAHATKTTGQYAYGIFNYGKLTVNGGTIEGHADKGYGYGIYTQVSANATQASNYAGTTIINDGIITGSSNATYAYGVYANATFATNATSATDGTLSNKASARLTINGGKIVANSTGRYCYGVVVLGDYNSYNPDTKTDGHWTTVLRDAVVEATGSQDVYGIQATTQISSSTGTETNGDVELYNMDVTARTTTAGGAYATWSVATSRTITNTASGYYPGEYASQGGKLTIYSGNYKAYSGVSTAYATGSSTRSRTVAGNASGYSTLIIHGGDFFAETTATEARAICSGGWTTVDGGTFTAHAKTTTARGAMVVSGKTILNNVSFDVLAETGSAFGLCAWADVADKTLVTNAGELVANNVTVVAKTNSGNTAEAVRVNTARRALTSDKMTAGYEPGDFTISAKATINGGSYTAIAAGTTAYGINSVVCPNLDVTPNPSWPELEVHDATFTATTKGTSAVYGARIGGPTIIDNCTFNVAAKTETAYGLLIDHKKTTVSNSTFNVSATTKAYGIYANAAVADKTGYATAAEVESTNNTYIVNATESTTAYGAYVLSAKRQITSTAAGYTPGDYASAATVYLTDDKMDVTAATTTARAVYTRGLAKPSETSEVGAMARATIDGGYYKATATSTVQDVFNETPKASDGFYPPEGEEPILIKGGFFKNEANLDFYKAPSLYVNKLKSGEDAEYAEGYRFEVGAPRFGTPVCKNGSKEYLTLEAALEDVNNGTVNGGTIVMTLPYTLPAGNYKIPSNTTLLVPYKSGTGKGANQAIGKAAQTTNPSSITAVQTPSCYLLLTLASGAHIDVYGTVEASAQQFDYTTSSGTSIVYGPYGQIHMEEGSSMSLESGAYLQAWGYITGKGETTAHRGSTVIENFQVFDWKGGTVLSNGFMSGSSAKKVFPVNQYFIQSVESPVIYRPGSHLTSSFHTSVKILGTQGSDDVGVVGEWRSNSDKDVALFLMDAADMSDDTWVRKEYDAVNDIQLYTVNSSAMLSAMKINTGTAGTVNSAEYDLPLGSNFKIVVNSGRLQITQDVQMFVGSEIEVYKEGDLQINSGCKVYLWDNNEWGKFAYSGKYVKTVSYCPSWKTSPRLHQVDSKASIPDATINIHGTMTIVGGLYTTNGGASILSNNKDAGKIMFQNATAATNTSFYQVSTYSDNKPQFDAYTATPAQLKNEDGTFTSTVGANNGKTYAYSEGRWQCWEQVGSYQVDKSDDANWKWYANPSDFVQVKSNETDNHVTPVMDEDHLYPSADETRFFILMDGCMWWEVSLVDDNLCYSEMNDTYYQWNGSKWVIKSFVITWKDWNGTTLDTYNNVKYRSMPKWLSATPTKAKQAGDPAGSYYIFSGWTPDLDIVTENTTYTATYELIVPKYDVLWKNEDGSKTLHISRWAEGEHPAYDGAEIKKATSMVGVDLAHNGWSTAANGAGTRYGLTDELPAMGAAAQTYYATFAEGYIITWKNEDGTVLDRKLWAAGTRPTHANINKESDAQYDYVFAGWTPEVLPVEADAEYTAVFTPVLRQYAITFSNLNGKGSSQVVNVNYGATPVCPVTPDRGNSAEYSYEWTGWKDAAGNTFGTDYVFPAVAGDATYTATFSQTTRTYTVTWKNEDGSVLERVRGLAFGDAVPDYSGATPEKEPTRYLTYGFAGWTPAKKATIDESGDQEYRATYDAGSTRYYTVRWLMDNGDLIDETNLEYDQMPTHADPRKASNALYSYDFAGWTPAISVVKGDAEYKATFNAIHREYEITYILYDDVKNVVRYEAEAAVATPATPTREGYTFDGWDKEIPATMPAEDMTITANWTINQYTIRFENEGGALLQSVVVEHGQTPAYTGATPTKSATAQYSYTFTGWTPAIAAATANATYTATFNATKNKYTIIFKNEDGTELQKSDVEYGVVPSYTGATPAKTATAEYTYTFKGWDVTPVAVTGTATYTATFNQTRNQYTVSWDAADGELSGVYTDGLVDYGTTIVAPTATKDGYEFDSWSPAVPGTVTEDLNFTAQWRANKFTLSFYLDEAKTQLYQSYTLKNGDPIVAPEDPTLPGYNFIGWDYVPGTMPNWDVDCIALWEVEVNDIVITEDETISTPTEVDSLTIKAGAELTASATITAQNITIEATGELNTSAAVTVVQNLVFQTNESDDVATAVINGDLEVRGEAYLEMKITSARWHTVVLPSDVNTEDVLVDGESNKFRNMTEGWLMRAFDAAEYACVGAAKNNKGGQNGWYNVTSATDPTTATTMQANVGYLVGLTHADESEEHTLRFPITVGVQNTDLMVSTTAATGSQPEIYHGWNFVGVPYVSHYETEDFNSGAIEIVTYPVEGGGSFKQAWLGDVTLKPFSAYFFQVSSDLNMAYEEEQRVGAPQAEAPTSVAARMRAKETSSVGSTRLGLVLTNSHNETDKTWFNLNDNFTTNYEIGKDLSKMFGSSYKNYTEPVLYTCTSLGRMAFTAIPYATAEQMTPVGFYAAENGTYTFSLNTKGDMEDVQAVMLYDAETGATTNLLWYDYEFYSTRQVQNEERFSLYIMRAPKTPTDINNTGTSNDSKHIQKVIQENKLYILIDNTMFDATGKRVH